MRVLALLKTGEKQRNVKKTKDIRNEKNKGEITRRFSKPSGLGQHLRSLLEACGLLERPPRAGYGAVTPLQHTKVFIHTYGSQFPDITLLLCSFIVISFVIVSHIFFILSLSVFFFCCSFYVILFLQFFHFI